jgi:eukaryotic-like serine/threonine-protein kinase
VVASPLVSSGEKDLPRSAGRYVLFQELAHGGTTIVHLARLRELAGFTRTVAIKRLQPSLAFDPELVSSFIDEARLAAHIRHPNVVSVLDVVAGDEGEPLVVTDYIPGEPLSQLIRVASRQRIPMPRRVLVTILLGVLTGLDAAHEARGEGGNALEIVHRDVSPQKVLLGLDGVPMVFDFGQAKTTQHARSTQPGSGRSTIGYKAPEQLTAELVDRRSDIYAAGVMLWEGLTGKRLFSARTMSEEEILAAKKSSSPPLPPSSVISSTPKALDEIVLKALSHSRDNRFATAREMASALENALGIVPNRQVGEWVAQVAGPALAARAAEVSEMESLEAPASLGRSEVVSIPLDVSRVAAAKSDLGMDGDEGVSLLPPATTNPPRAIPGAEHDVVAILPGLLPRMETSSAEPSGAPPPRAAKIPATPPARRRFGWGTVLASIGLLAAAVWVIGSQLTAEPDASPEAATNATDPPPPPPLVPAKQAATAELPLTSGYPEAAAGREGSSEATR